MYNVPYTYSIEYLPRNSIIEGIEMIQWWTNISPPSLYRNCQGMGAQVILSRL